MQPITTEQATIRTATVEIKALTLGRKQMTLSVFRQLPSAHVIEDSEDGPRLKGEPWGLVNYYWDGCGYGRRNGHHLHVVWVGGGRLFRCCAGALGVSTSGGKVYGDPEGVSRLGRVLNEEDGWPCVAFCRCGDGGLSEHGRRFIRGWNEVYEDLAALDQLFIAV